MPQRIEDLIAAVQHEAEQTEFPIDVAIYDRAGRVSKTPILLPSIAAGIRGSLRCLPSAWTR